MLSDKCQSVSPLIRGDITQLLWYDVHVCVANPCKEVVPCTVHEVVEGWQEMEIKVMRRWYGGAWLARHEKVVVSEGP